MTRPSALRRPYTASLATILLLALVMLPSAVGIAASAAWNADTRPVVGLDMRLQTQPSSCGPALIAALSTLHGRPLDESHVLAKASMGEDGVSLAEFARLASLHDLDGAWYRVERDRLEQLPLPYVAHLDTVAGGHYVAIVAVGGGAVVVLDPAVGAVVGPAASLLGRFSGRVFLLDGVTRRAS